MKKKQKGPKGFIAITLAILIIIIGVVGIQMSSMSVTTSRSFVDQLHSTQAFYMAEAGLEFATNLILHPTLSTRVACGNLTGTSSVTNSNDNISSSPGVFTVTSSLSSGPSTPTTLAANITASATTIPVASISNHASVGRIMIDKEVIDYYGTSTSSSVCGAGISACFLNAHRGVDGTVASSHNFTTNPARVAQYQCNLTSSGGVPTLSTSSTALKLGKRTLTESIQLEEGWIGGFRLGLSNWNLYQWNRPTEKTFTQSSASGSAGTIRDISIVSNADVWTGGAGGIVLHYDGSSQSRVEGGIGGADVLSIAGISSVEAWHGNGLGDIYKWTGGTSWTKVYDGNRDIMSLSLVETTGDGQADVGWGVGPSATAIYYNGSTWASQSSGLSGNVRGVSTVSTTDAWLCTASGTIFHWTGGPSWSSVSGLPASSRLLKSISMMNWEGTTIGWVAGDAQGGTATAWYYNGSTWTATPSGLPTTLDLEKVVTLSPTEAWVVGGSSVYEWDGSTWTLVFTSGNALRAIDMLRPKKQAWAGWQESFQ